MWGRRLPGTMISDRILEHPELLLLKRPAAHGPAGADPEIAARVSEILLAIERGGEPELRRVSRELDGWDPPSFEVGPEQVAAATASLPAALRESIEFAQAQIALEDPSRTPEFGIDLYRNITNLNLRVARIAPTHSNRAVPYDNLKKAIGILPVVPAT